MYGMNVPMSPDDHYQDLKRVIAAVSGKARRINVIMPMLYEGRQHRRTSRESLDCALCLQMCIRDRPGTGQGYRTADRLPLGQLPPRRRIGHDQMEKNGLEAGGSVV